MSTMTIRGLDEALKQRLRMRAAEHRRSMEEARDILRTSLSTESSGPSSLVESIRSKIEPLGRVEFELPPRDPIRIPPDLGK